jgi:hypothetical protein
MTTASEYLSGIYQKKQIFFKFKLKKKKMAKILQLTIKNNIRIISIILFDPSRIKLTWQG